MSKKNRKLMMGKSERKKKRKVERKKIESRLMMVRREKKQKIQNLLIGSNQIGKLMSLLFSGQELIHFVVLMRRY
jgi:hypothetical protein